MKSLNTRRGNSREHRKNRFNLETLEPRMLLSAGSLIGTFGNQGIATVAGEAPVASVAQPDGKIITIGQSGSIRRFNTDGSLDQNFGTGGAVQTTVPKETVEFDSVALQKDGSIVVGGALSNAATMFRFTSSGAIDKSLGNGSGLAYFGGINGPAQFIAVQNSGKILLGGSQFNLPSFITQLNSDGTVDNTFGGGGFAAGSLPLKIDGMALDSSGRILIDGDSQSSPHVVSRLLPSGFFDNTYSGVVPLPEAGAPIARPDGSALVPVAVSGGGAFPNLGMEALTPAGQVDTSFANQGIASGSLTFLDSNSTIRMALQSNGTIDVATVGVVGDQSELAIERFRGDGTIDPSFGSMGTATASLPSGTTLDAIIYTSDQRITAVGDLNGNIILSAFSASTPTGSISGTVYNDANGDDQRQGSEAGLSGRTVFLDANHNGALDAGETSTVTDSTGHYTFSNLVVGQYYVNDVQPAGWKAPLNFSPTTVAQSQTTILNFASSKIDTTMPFDTSFGSGGIDRISFTDGRGLARQSDGKLLLIGTNGVARYTSAGALDKTFGSNGWVSDPVPQSQLEALALQSDGKIVVGAIKPLTPSGSSYGIALARLNSNGSIDQTYGSSGIASTPTAGIYNFPMLIVRPDNSVIVASPYYAPAPGFALTLINNQGQADGTFGVGGYVGLTIDKTTIETLALGSNNSIILAGDVIDNLNTDGVVMRLTAAGKVDSTFGTGGRVLTVAATPILWSAVTLQSDGKIIAAGLDNFHFAAARFNANGLADASFGSGGLAVTSTAITTLNSATILPVAFVAQRPDGGIVIAGSIGHTAYEQYDFAAALLTASGQLDSRFGHGGQAWAGLSASLDMVAAALLQPDQKLVMIGGAGQFGQTALVRFNLPSTTPPTLASISGVVFADNNGNGSKDSTESGISGRKLYIDKNKNGVLDAGEPTITTGSAGTYTFSLAAGTYRIRDVLPGGWRRISPGSGYYDLTVSAGQIITGKNFAETTRGLISGTVFRDANGNGVKDSTEVGLAGWVVFLDTNNNGKLDSGERSFTTGSDGKFSFVVPAGTYHLREVLKSGFKRTTPSIGVYSITLASGQSATDRNFGDK